MTRISLRSCGPAVRFIRIIDSTLSILILSTHRVLNLGTGTDDKSLAVKVRWISNNLVMACLPWWHCSSFMLVKSLPQSYSSPMRSLTPKTRQRKRRLIVMMSSKGKRYIIIPGAQTLKHLTQRSVPISLVMVQTKIKDPFKQIVFNTEKCV